VTIALSGEQGLSIVDLPADPTWTDRLRAVIPWPDRFSTANFRDVFADQPFGRWLLNSAIVSAFTTLLGVTLACTAGYAFSRFRFPGRRAGLMSFLVSQMFPGVLMMIPLYIIIVKWLGLGSTWTGLVLIYTMTAIPFCVWMLKGYFDTIPRELEESALIDGASPARVFFTIVLPLAKPAVAVTALFSFMTAWNEFIQAATFMDKETMYTAPVGLRFFVGGFQQEWGYFAAGSIITAIPVVALFLFLQRYLVSGLTAGAVKG
jgi:arabinogalactan oligomer / maltooligosaccharide transport system permease protein